MNIQAYKNKYHNDNGEGRFVDKWMESIKILPFTSNPSTAFDKKCSLQGVAGEFFRLWEGCGTLPIKIEHETLKGKLEAYLTTNGMSKSEIVQFYEIFKDVLFVDGNLNVTDSAFLKFQPYLPYNNSLAEKEQNKYKAGEIKLANYVFSMMKGDLAYPSQDADENLFIKVLRGALRGNGISSSSYTNSEKYYILPFVASSFKTDFNWLMEQEEIVKSKYLCLFFYFYACYGVTQSILAIKNKASEKPVPMYFMLALEKASANHDAVLRGWQKHFPQGCLEHLYGDIQAIDIINTLLVDDNGVVGLYPELLSKLQETPFMENKSNCEWILHQLHDDKIQMFSHRNSESADGYKEISLSVDSYEEFIIKLRHICIGMQSPSYTSRIKKKVTDLLGVRFLQTRRGYRVLTLDNEMLLFLIAMMTQNQKTKLEDMYKKFMSYGICFNRGTRLLVEDYLLKLNLLDRKSDSGEAQYVKVVL